MRKKAQGRLLPGGLKGISEEIMIKCSINNICDIILILELASENHRKSKILANRLCLVQSE
jgi:hypothetical protein